MILQPLVLIAALFWSAWCQGDQYLPGPELPGSAERAVVEDYYAKVRSRLKPYFDFHQLSWPPQRITLLAFKDTRLLEMWAHKQDRQWVHIKDFRLKGLSGTVGPKLREGDRQVPEGFYAIEALNPHSRYHLSLKINYPNAHDRFQALLEDRKELGGDIFIHGKAVSSGCLAIGDNAIEELFVLTSLMGSDAVDLIISPRDFRFRPFSTLPDDLPAWSYALNRNIAQRLHQYPLSEK